MSFTAAIIIGAIGAAGGIATASAGSGGRREEQRLAKDELE